MTVRALTQPRLRILAGLLLVVHETPEPMSRVIAAVQRVSSKNWSLLIERAVLRGELNNQPPHELLSRIPSAIVMNLALTMENIPDDALAEQLTDAVMIPALRPMTPLIKP